MSSKVNIKQLEEQFCKIAGINFDLREKDGSSDLFPILVLGEKGIGKTALIPQFAKRLAQERGEPVNVTTIYLSTQEPADLLGMPIVEKDGKTTATRYARPEWLPSQDSKECHIIVCDEYNRAPIYVQQPMLPFSIQGRLHTHNLPKKSIVVFLCNPASEDYVVTPFNDSAFYDRMARFSLAPDKKEWIKHAETVGVAECVIEAANKLNNLLQCSHVLDEHDIKVNPSNRTFTKLGIIMQNAGHEWISKHGETLAMAYVGPEAAVAIMKQHEKLLDSVPTPEDILQHFDKKVKKWIEANTKKENYQAGKIGEVHNTLSRYMKKNVSAIGKDKNQISNLSKWLSYLSDDQLAEFLLPFISETVENGGDTELCELIAELDISNDSLYERIIPASEKAEKKKKEATK